jgi:hypothetical protein
MFEQDLEVLEASLHTIAVKLQKTRDPQVKILLLAEMRQLIGRLDRRLTVPPKIATERK